MYKKIGCYLLAIMCLGLMFAGCGKEVVETQEEISEGIHYQEYTDLPLYDKLGNHEKVEILILGDSIGANSGASEHTTRWDTLFSQKISDTYGSSVGLTNLSVPGTGSLFGIIKMVEENIDLNNYDLAVICYGNNDGEGTFNIYYEALVRHLKINNPQIEILSILESSQKDEKVKIEKFHEICEYYELGCADTIKEFHESGKKYEELVKDGVHPNDEGYKLYAKALGKVLDLRFQNKVQGKIIEEALREEAEAFQNCTIIPLDSMIKSEKGYSIDLETSAIGTYYLLDKNGGPFTVSINGQAFERNNKQDAISMESYELLYRSTTDKHITFELMLDKSSEESFYGIFVFNRIE